MNPIRVEQQYGYKVKTAIDDFYRLNGSNSVVRKEDLFFIAYSGEKIIGCVRFCVEEGVPMLRTMRVGADFQKQGVGQQLLIEFARHLDANKIRNVFCLPYPHLEKFYGLINFKIAPLEVVPPFLTVRSAAYAKNGTHTVYMRRP